MPVPGCRSTLRRSLLVGLAAIVLLACGRPAHAEENPLGLDRDSAAADQALADVRPHLVPILSSDNRTGLPLAGELVRAHPIGVIEVLKRFRNPELWRVYVRLAEHDDWRVRHRALFALGRLPHPWSFRQGWHALIDDDPRVRARGAITCVETWDSRETNLPGGARDIRHRLDIETDARVLGALRALLALAEGRLEVQVVHEEARVELDDGLLFVPFVRDWEALDRKAVWARPKSFRRSSARRATDVEPGVGWMDPVYDFTERLVEDPSIESFGQQTDGVDGRHAGVDVAAGMDGAGVHAIGAGVVRAVRAGGPEGTVIAVQYHLGDRRLVNAVHMHCGDKVFVKCGDAVEPGQLLGTVGMAYSTGNGGRIAHLHFALHPAERTEAPPLVPRMPGSRLFSWYDPAWYLPRWKVARRALLPHVPR